jgi:hypothetical protein
LSDIHNVVLVFQNSSLVVVDIQVVRGTEDCHNAGESGSPSLSVHAIPGVLCLVRADHRQKVVLLEERTGSRIREEVGTSSDMVVDEEVVRLLLAKLFQRVSPENVAHQAVGRGLSESVNLRTVSIVCELEVIALTLFRSSRV